MFLVVVSWHLKQCLQNLSKWLTSGGYWASGIQVIQNILHLPDVKYGQGVRVFANKLAQWVICRVFLRFWKRIGNYLYIDYTETKLILYENVDHTNSRRLPYSLNLLLFVAISSLAKWLCCVWITIYSFILIVFYLFFLFFPSCLSFCFFPSVVGSFSPSFLPTFLLSFDRSFVHLFICRQHGLSFI